jgi:hypothetical protein
LSFFSGGVEGVKVAIDIEQFWPRLMRGFVCVAPIAAATSVALILMGLLGADHAHDTLFTSLGYATLAMFALTFTLVGIMVMLAILSAWRVIGGTLLTLLALAGVMAAVQTMGVLTTLLLVIAVGAWRIASVLHTASHPAPTARS